MKNNCSRKVAAFLLCLFAFGLSVSPIIGESSSSAQSGLISNTIVSTNLGGPFNDPFYGSTVAEVQQGSTLNVLVVLQNFRSSICGTVGCNVSVGFAFDTIPNFTTSTGTGYTNASNANPSNLLVALPAQTYQVTFSMTAPSSASNLALHNYGIVVVNFSKRGSINATQTLLDSLVGNVAIISAQQENYWRMNQNYTQLNTGYYTIFSGILASQNNYQYSAAASHFSTASTLYSKAQQEYLQANFGQANTTMSAAYSEYQLAVSSYQASAQSLASSNNTYLSLVPYGAILLGIGAVIAGLGLVLAAFIRRD